MAPSDCGTHFKVILFRHIPEAVSLPIPHFASLEPHSIQERLFSLRLAAAASFFAGEKGRAGIP